MSTPDHDLPRAILLFCVLLTMSIYLVYKIHYGSEEVITAKVVSAKMDCESRTADCIHKVYTVDPEGRREILINTSTIFRNKKDVEAIKGVRAGSTYLFHVNGFRSFTFSTFRNILDLQELAPEGSKR